MAKYGNIGTEKRMMHFRFNEKKSSMKFIGLTTFSRQVESPSGRKEFPGSRESRKASGAGAQGARGGWYEMTLERHKGTKLNRVS